MADDLFDDDEFDSEALSEAQDLFQAEVRKKKILAVGALVVGLLVGAIGVWAVAAAGALPGVTLAASDPRTATVAMPGNLVFHELPQVVADLKTGRCRAPLVRLTIIIEIGEDDVDRLEEVQTKALDALRVHLREQERAALVGKKGHETLRYMVRRIFDQAMAPARIANVVFKDFVLQ